MKYFSFLIFIGLALLLFSCTSKKDANSNQSLTKQQYFKQIFFKKFKTLELPCKLPHQPLFNEGEYEYSNPETSDSLIVNGTWMTCYGALPDTTNFYTLIYYAPAVTRIPVIVTYDKSGQQISDMSTDFGCWGGGGMADYTCDGFMKIGSDLSITVEHTTTCLDCDSTSNNPVKYFSSSKGKILKTGKIEYEDHQRDY